MPPGWRFRACAPSRRSIPEVDRVLVSVGAFAALLGVAMGAFAAHGLESRLLDLGYAEVFETAVRYHMWHALGLILIGALHKQRPTLYLAWAGWLMAFGVVLFSGSLYILALSGETGWGAVAPIGGTAFLMAWLLVALGVLLPSDLSDV
ncbi:DUF423 domain-containing protein [Ectothiorhodospiraceae bacterium 2226]|nr:DUF423 domain-containing protein [Ectothiorhodospiraceae bacterium 2226]